jgi:phosphotransferase system HPr (HPr) family protein
MNPEADMTMDLNLSEHSRDLTISNILGLHARAAARLVHLVGEFHSDVYLEKNDEQVKADSVLSLLTLECPVGTKVVVRAQGDDAWPAVEAITKLFKDKFGEE